MSPGSPHSSHRDKLPSWDQTSPEPGPASAGTPGGDDCGLRGAQPACLQRHTDPAPELIEIQYSDKYLTSASLNDKILNDENPR